MRKGLVPLVVVAGLAVPALVVTAASAGTAPARSDSCRQLQQQRARLARAGKKVGYCKTGSTVKSAAASVQSIVNIKPQDDDQCLAAELSQGTGRTTGTTRV